MKNPVFILVLLILLGGGAIWWHQLKNGGESEQQKSAATQPSTIQIAPKENIPVRLNARGLVEIDALKATNLTANQLERLRKEIKVTNQYIQDGIMKFDEDMNLLFDNRGESN